MYCFKCGSALSDDSSFCTHCGAPVAGAEELAQSKPANKKPLIFAIIASCVALTLILGAFLIIPQIQKNNLHKDLMREWSRVESSDGSYYTLVLDFSDDEIVYDFESFYINDTIATFDYEVVSADQIKVDNRSTLYTIEFNDDKTMMIISPALTSSDSLEYWFDHG